MVIICGMIKQNESELKHIIFFSFLLGVMLHSKSYVLQKTPLKLDLSFQSYDLLKCCQNNRKQKDLFPLFGSISKSIFANSNSFCLIIPHMQLCRFLVKIGLYSLSNMACIIFVCHFPKILFHGFAMEIMFIKI